MKIEETIDPAVIHRFINIVSPNPCTDRHTDGPKYYNNPIVMKLEEGEVTIKHMSVWGDYETLTIPVGILEKYLEAFTLAVAFYKTIGDNMHPDQKISIGKNDYYPGIRCTEYGVFDGEGNRIKYEDVELAFFELSELRTELSELSKVLKDINERMDEVTGTISPKIMQEIMDDILVNIEKESGDTIDRNTEDGLTTIARPLEILGALTQNLNNLTSEEDEEKLSAHYMKIISNAIYGLASLQAEEE